MKGKYKIIFAGSPDFAVPALEALIDAGHELVLVLTQADRPRGRGQKKQATPVKTVALANGIKVLTPESLRVASPEKQELMATEADFLVTAAYGQLLPREILDLPAIKPINIHASLLPAYRGAAPIQASLLAGDKESGISIIEMTEALDAGDVYYQLRCPITESETGGSLFMKLAMLGAEAVVDCLEQWSDLIPQAQNTKEVSWTTKLTKASGAIDWAQSAEAIERSIRAYTPWPSSFTYLDGEFYKVHRAQLTVLEFSGLEPGQILIDKRRLLVQCGQGMLEILELQKAGQRRLEAKEISHNLESGRRFYSE